MKAFQSRSGRLVTTCIAILSVFAFVSCEKPPRTGVEMPDDPSDETVAIFRFEDGKQVIYSGKLHSRRFKKICSGDYPRVSPSGRWVAYNPIKDASHRNPAIQPIEVIEIQTGQVTTFASIPRDLTPWPESVWSSDEKLITFQVHDFNGNRVRCVVNRLDGSYWRGTDAEFGAKYGTAFGPTELDARKSVDGRLSIENYKHVGALYLHSGNGKSIRLTPETMGVASTPIWIARTGEALFVGSYVARRTFKEDSVEPGNVYLIKPEALDWANASRSKWKAAIVTSGEQVSTSK